MSGGHFDYVGYQIEDALRFVAAGSAEDFPAISALLMGFGSALKAIEHDLDWHYSGDTNIADTAAYDHAAIGRLLECVMKAAPDAWFPRGKWATIQAIQERVGGKS